MSTPQLPLTLRAPPDQRLDAFLGHPGVSAAVAACARGESRDWLYLEGPTGAGKSHLLLAACAEAGVAGRRAAYLPLAMFAGRLADALAAQESADLVCLDGLEAIAGQPPLPRFVTQGPTPSDGSIEIRDLRFGWDRHTPVFNGFDLSIRSGEHVLLRGASGGGKSTLIQLLTRFEDPQGGSIHLGGVPLAALDEHTVFAAVKAV